jgi:hypothetical protein
MIDWINLGGNALWVLGLALGLATLSFAVWQASFTGVSFRTIFSSRVFLVYSSLAEILFCLGLIVMADSLLERGLWLLISVAALISFILSNRNRQN